MFGLLIVDEGLLLTMTVGCTVWNFKLVCTLVFGLQKELLTEPSGDLNVLRVLVSYEVTGGTILVVRRFP